MTTHTHATTQLTPPTPAGRVIVGLAIVALVLSSILISRLWASLPAHTTRAPIIILATARPTPQPTQAPTPAPAVAVPTAVIIRETVVVPVYVEVAAPAPADPEADTDLAATEPPSDAARATTTAWLADIPTAPPSFLETCAKPEARGSWICGGKP